MKKILLSLAVGLLFCVQAFPQNVGTVVQSKNLKGPVILSTFVWTAGTNNNSVCATGTVFISGEVLRVTFIPSTGSTAPTGAYTVVMSDGAGIDLLTGKGAALSATVASSIRPGISYPSTTNAVAPFAINDLLVVAVTNCGNSARGSILVYSK